MTHSHMNDNHSPQPMHPWTILFENVGTKNDDISHTIHTNLDYMCGTVIVILSCLQLDKATNPVNKDNDWESIKAFWDQLNNEADG